MSRGLRWAARQPRVWFALLLGLGAGALVLTGHSGGLVLTLVASSVLLPVRERYEAAHPDVAERRTAKEQAKVDAILARYEAEAEARRDATRTRA